MSNAWVIYLRVGDNLPKGGLIPHDMALLDERTSKLEPQGLAPGEKPASD